MTFIGPASPCNNTKESKLMHWKLYKALKEGTILKGQGHSTWNETVESGGEWSSLHGSQVPHSFIPCWLNSGDTKNNELRLFLLPKLKTKGIFHFHSLQCPTLGPRKKAFKKKKDTLLLCLSHHSNHCGNEQKHQLPREVAEVGIIVLLIQSTVSHTHTHFFFQFYFENESRLNDHEDRTSKPSLPDRWYQETYTKSYGRDNNLEKCEILKINGIHISAFFTPRLQGFLKCFTANSEG